MKKSTDAYDEVSYIITKDQEFNLYHFLSELDARIGEFDVKSYGLQLPSLEDVFLKINLKKA